MTLQKINLLITGTPGVGKTTLIKNIAEKLRPLNPVGFYTSEIREGGIRRGFELVNLDGQRALLSHVRIKSPFRVSKYGVDVPEFERFLDGIPFLGASIGLVVIDEIGKMECFSEKFKRRVQDILDSKKSLVATVALKGSGFVSDVKGREDIRLMTITRENRDTLAADILEHLKLYV